MIRAETDLALSRTGSGVGTPILTFDPGTPGEASFFGPVLGRIPRGDEALEIWDTVVTLARTPRPLRAQANEPPAARLQLTGCASRAERSAHSSQTESGIRPTRISTAKTLQPRQMASTDSSVAATAIAATSSHASPGARAVRR